MYCRLTMHFAITYLGGGRYSNCSQNMLIRNAHVKYGVGMTIGSVSPNVRHNCVRNITFENVHFDSPLKGIYIKTDPGDSGDGEIDNITYRNISMSSALWYPIWIGPQQQKQPGMIDRCFRFFSRHTFSL